MPPLPLPPPSPPSKLKELNFYLIIVFHFLPKAYPYGPTYFTNA